MKFISTYLDSHFQESFTINEAGMKLTPEVYEKIRRRLKCLESKAPATSRTHLKFESKNKRIRGELLIIGQSKKFSSEVKGTNPWEIYKYLEEQIDKQLIEWKKERFEKNIFGPSAFEEQKVLAGRYAL